MAHLARSIARDGRHLPAVRDLSISPHGPAVYAGGSWWSRFPRSRCVGRHVSRRLRKHPAVGAEPAAECFARQAARVAPPGGRRGCSERADAVLTDAAGDADAHPGVPCQKVVSPRRLSHRSLLWVVWYREQPHTTGAFELYDLVADPNETCDLSADK